MKRSFSKAFSLLLGIVICVSLLPMNVAANESGSTQNLKSLKVGEVFTFGAYEQDNNLDNGKEPIEWIVLTKNGSRILALSKKALYGRKFNKNVNSTWENCSLRTWLNNEFLNDAFSPGELAMIPTVTVSAEKNPKQPKTPAGKATKDKVFLLSMNEGTKYLKGKSYLKCYPTEYAVANGCNRDDKTGECWWWFRTPGINTKRAVFYSVNSRKIYDRGYGVHQKGGAVRPAIWIDTAAAPTSAASSPPAAATTNSVNWAFENGVLTISGTGAMTNYYTYSSIDNADIPPWDDFHNDVKTVIVKEGITAIGNGAFREFEALRNVSIPSSVTYIGEEAFYHTGLTSVTIPQSVAYIGIDAFAACGSLSAINVVANNRYYSSSGGVLFDKNKTTLIQAPGALSGAYEIPEGVTIIGCTRSEELLKRNEHMFYNWSGFCGCAITCIKIPASVKIIHDCAFWDCQSLTDVYYAGTIADSKLISIGSGENWLLQEAKWHYSTSAGGQTGQVLGIIDMDYVLRHSKNNEARDKYVAELCRKLGLNINDYSRYTFVSTEFLWASHPLSRELIMDEGCTTIIINDYHDSDEPYKAADALAQEFPDVAVILANDPDYIANR